MTDSPLSSTNPHDAGLPPPLVRKRRHFRKIAHVMLVIAVLSAIPAWYLIGRSFYQAARSGSQPWYQVVLGYFLLIISSATLLLGLWYLLLAQVRRIAREVHEEQHLPATGRPTCPNCGWPHDPPDRFCRHCGKPVGTSISPARRPPN